MVRIGLGIFGAMSLEEWNGDVPWRESLIRSCQNSNMENFCGTETELRFLVELILNFSIASRLRNGCKINETYDVFLEHRQLRSG